MSPKRFSTRQVAAITGLPYMAVHDWAAKGIITPSIQARGRGSAREYSVADLVALKVASILRTMGAPPTRMTGLLQEVQRLAKAGTKHLYVSLMDNGVFITSAEDTLVGIAHSANVTIVVNVGKVLNDTTLMGTDEQVRALPTRCKPH